MAGRPGRSGGWNRLTPEQHAKRGTKPRYRTRPVLVLATARLEPPPVAVVDGLTGPGRAFVEDCWQTWSGWTPKTLTLLRQAGQLLDDCEQLHGKKGERQAQRLLLQTLAALRLEE